MPQAEGATAPLSAAFEPLTYDEEPQFYRWEDGLRDYIGRVNAWREFRALTEEKATAFEDGVRSVMSIRCMEHREVPQYNRNEATGAECPACEVTGLRAALAKRDAQWAAMPAEWRRQVRERVRRLEAGEEGVAVLGSSPPTCPRCGASLYEDAAEAGYCWDHNPANPNRDTGRAALGDAPQPAPASLEATISRICFACDGHGGNEHGQTCPHCGGSGTLVVVDIARMAGKGDGE